MSQSYSFLLSLYSQEHNNTCLLGWVGAVLLQFLLCDKSVPMGCTPQEPQALSLSLHPHGTGKVFSTLASLSLKLVWKWGWTVLTKTEVWVEELEWAFRWSHEIISVSHRDKHSLEVPVLLIKSMDLWLKQVELMELGEIFVSCAGFINVSASGDKHPYALRSMCFYAKFGQKFWYCFCSCCLWMMSS